VEVGVYRLEDGTLRAVRNACPHKGAPICRGSVGGTWPPSAPGTLEYAHDGEILSCPWHGREYDLRSGREIYQPAPTRLRLYRIEVDDDAVVVIL
jgi:nitrite reductase/ring-hydroxylating ferredoxin subunit